MSSGPFTCVTPYIDVNMGVRLHWTQSVVDVDLRVELLATRNLSSGPGLILCQSVD